MTTRIFGIKGSIKNENVYLQARTKQKIAEDMRKDWEADRAQIQRVCVGISNEKDLPILFRILGESFKMRKKRCWWNLRNKGMN